MALPQFFNTAAYGTGQPTAPAPVLDPQPQFLEIPMHECVKEFSVNTPSVQDEGLIPQPYQYGVKLEFEPGRRDAFMKAPDFRQNYHAITNTIGEMMNDTLVWEMARDQGALFDHYDASDNAPMPDDDYSELMTSIHDNTFEDAKFVMQDLSGILKETFPDSGIVGAKLSYMQGVDTMCRPPMPAEVMSAEAAAPDADPLAGNPVARPALASLAR